MKKKILALLMTLTMIALLVGCGNREELERLQDELEATQDMLQTTQADHDAIQSDLEETQAYLGETQAELEAARAELEDEVASLSLIISDLQDKLDYLAPHIELSAAEAELMLESLDRQEIIEELEAQIEEKQAELDALDVQIRETGEAPISLGAGFFTSPDDVPPGRYRVTGSRNFFVSDRNGRNRVNIILGGGMFLDYFIFNLNSGDEIEALGPFVLTPVE